MLKNLAKKIYQPNMSEDEFLRKLFMETSIIIAGNQEHNKGKSIEQIKNGKIKYILQDLETGKFTPSVSQVLENIYNARRGANFPEDFKKITPLRLSQIKDNNGTMDLIEQDKWRFRLPKNRKQLGYSSNDKSVERLIVNALPDKNIVDILDDFCSKNKCIYKMPNAEDFSSRVDTVVVYAYEKLSEDAKKEFAQKMSPFVRESLPERTNDLDGNIISNGIAYAKELSKTELQGFIDNINHPQKEQFSQYLTNAKGEIKMSLGQKVVIEQFLEVKEKFFGNKKSNNNNSVFQNNNAFFDKEKNMVIFQPKEKSDPMTAYQSLKDAGLVLELSDKNKENKRFFTADMSNPENNKIMNKLIAENKKSQNSHTL